MSTQHTPGPLYAIHHGISGRYEIRKDYGNASYRIATLDDHAESEADAALFAAAPELLEALRDLVGHDSYRTEYDGRWLTLCPACGELDGEHSSICDFVRARAAIAKATGGAA